MGRKTVETITIYMFIFILFVFFFSETLLYSEYLHSSQINNDQILDDADLSGWSERAYYQFLYHHRRNKPQTCFKVAIYHVRYQRVLSEQSSDEYIE